MPPRLLKQCCSPILFPIMGIMITSFYLIYLFILLFDVSAQVWELWSCWSLWISCSFTTYYCMDVWTCGLSCLFTFIADRKWCVPLNICSTLLPVICKSVDMMTISFHFLIALCSHRYFNSEQASDLVVRFVALLIACHRGHHRKDVLDEREDRYLNGWTITTGCDLDRMSGGNRKVNITVTEYDLRDILLTAEAFFLWHSCTIDPML